MDGFGERTVTAGVDPVPAWQEPGVSRCVNGFCLPA
jgi:hypothetical protein